ncbi:uncharacterized protein RCC_02015 [Ramularia collo-cygni]|uniref:Heterokaryon incompatibility domain-containing protein n=1 Tax=Ramularia collo-cygni TaxID=112498 RepID=A0A2D3V746_9PEZI|nr:uncharacterized protein RCC_02015 [Ramularia collo-cygni]CZT16173.1 uncharacterized protein RCC_02015 [Ramularia collo-cygni]
MICLGPEDMQDIYTQSTLNRKVILRATITIAWPEVDLRRDTANFLAAIAGISKSLQPESAADDGVGLLQGTTVITADDLRRYEVLYRKFVFALFGRNSSRDLSSLINPLALLRRLFGSAVPMQNDVLEQQAIIEICSLLDSEYFGRMLSFPDFVLSKQIFLRCTSVDLEWNAFCSAVYSMVMYGVHAGMKSSQAENLLIADLLRQRYHNSRLSFAEGLLAIQGCNFEETHTASFVFPLLALSNSDRREHALPRVDYAEGEQQVLQSISTALGDYFKAPINLSLSGLPNSEGRSGYPTWLPEFGPKQRMILAHPNSRLATSALRSYDFVVDESRKGRCRGARVDTVAVVKSYLAPRRICDQYDLTGDNLFELLRWYKFACGTETTDMPNNSSDELIVQFAETIQAKGSNHIWDSHQKVASSEVVNRTRGFMDFLEDPETPETHDIRLFYAACLPSHDRRFGKTTAGRFCLLPSAAAFHDIVCIIQGFKVPVLLRPTGSGYQNVGECYVHGIMEGELDSLEEEIFLLE